MWVSVVSSLWLGATGGAAGAAGGSAERPALELEQPPLAIGLSLAGAEGPAWARVTLPSIVEVLRFSNERRLELEARTGIPATLELGDEEPRAIVIDLDAVRGQSDPQGRVRGLRALALRDERGALLARLLIDLELEILPQSLAESRIAVRQARVVTVAEGYGFFANRELARPAQIAHPKVPLIWSRPSTHIRWSREGGQITGLVELAAGLYPEVFETEAGLSIVLETRRLDTPEVETLVLKASEAGEWKNPKLAIEWLEDHGKWTALVRYEGPQDVRDLRLRFGDASSPMSVDARSSWLPAERQASVSRSGPRLQ